MVAMLGAIVPLPLPMAPTVQVLPPSSNWMAYSFVGVGGHDGGGSVGAALLVRSQLCGGGRMPRAKGSMTMG